MASTFTAQLEFSFREAVKLLVVDDDADTRQMISVYFSGQEYSVATASSGKEALDAMKRNGNFDLVLLDLVIPDIGGLELLTDINRRSEPPSVIVLTGLADKQIAQNALRLGAFDCIPKPYNLSQVESTVVACLAHREYVKKHWWKRFA